MDERLRDEAERIRAGRELNHFDMSAVETVAGLVLRVLDAQAIIAEEGAVIVEGGQQVEHPAVVVERRASQEIRGWVKDRPDLFGVQKQPRQTRRRPDFTVVV